MVPYWLGYTVIQIITYYDVCLIGGILNSSKMLKGSFCCDLDHCIPGSMRKLEILMSPPLVPFRIRVPSRWVFLLFLLQRSDDRFMYHHSLVFHDMDVVRYGYGASGVGTVEHSERSTHHER